MVVDRSFHVAAPPDAVWSLIKDIPRVLPHVPGAQLLESLSERAHTAGITLQRGPLQGTYDVSVNVQSLDDQTRTAVVRITAGDVAGRGGVDATITAIVQPAAGGSNIAVHVDVEGSGAAAMMSDGVMHGAQPNAANDFVANLERTLRR